MNFRKSEYSNGVGMKMKSREKSKSIGRRNEYFLGTSTPFTKSSSLQNLNLVSRPSSTNDIRHSGNVQPLGKKKIMCEKVYSDQKLTKKNSNLMTTTTDVRLWGDVEDSCNTEHKKSIDIFVNSKFNEISVEEFNINIKQPLTSNHPDIKRKSIPSILRIGMSPSPSKTNNESYQQKKQVTFAVEHGRQCNRQINNSAETKRLLFRNSHCKKSKISDNPYNPIEDYDDNLTFENNASISDIIEKSREKNITLSKTTGTNNENRINNDIALNPTKDDRNIEIDKNKVMIKRKLKSCRSRSFHKSLNVASFTDVHDKNIYFTHKQFKGINPEIVTMVSLVPSSSSSMDEKNEEIENKMSLKLKLSVNTKIKVNDLNIQENTHSKIDQKSPSKNIFSSNTKIKMPISQNITQLKNGSMGQIESNDDKKRITVQSVEYLAPTSNSVKSILFIENKDPTLNKTKEEECWSSFHKMNNEGMNVSFDTILRGLLTPTEYRLRKDDRI